MTPTSGHMFVHADGRLAEILCNVELVALTPRRAEQLRRIHHGHRSDCRVLAAAVAYFT
ncbi:hypothetical protein ACWIGI_38670 [Nocardia sp. NPDC055321]